MQAYLKREHEAARFSMEDILNEELRLDRDDGEPRRCARAAPRPLKTRPLARRRLARVAAVAGHR